MLHLLQTIHISESLQFINSDLVRHLPLVECLSQLRILLGNDVAMLSQIVIGQHFAVISISERCQQYEEIIIGGFVN